MQDATTRSAGCELCERSDGPVVWADTTWRVVRVEDAAFPAFYRVISQPHVAEFTDLDASAQAHCMQTVATVERVLRTALRPTKINLASLGNVVAHLHWHVIARFEWDSHFPQPVWGEAQRRVVPERIQRLAASLPALDVTLNTALAGARTGAHD